MADYERELRGTDVIAAARQLGDGAHQAVARLVAPDVAIADAARLEQLAPPSAVGVSRGAWLAVFIPLFGEFE